MRNLKDAVRHRRSETVYIIYTLRETVYTAMESQSTIEAEKLPERETILFVCEVLSFQKVLLLSSMFRSASPFSVLNLLRPAQNQTVAV